jgi:hypothetical protein
LGRFVVRRHRNDDFSELRQWGVRSPLGGVGRLRPSFLGVEALC